jgi:hypothetical protein
VITTSGEIEDVSSEKQPNELANKKSTSNTDLLGTTDVLTQMGLMTGNMNITKAGLLSNSAIKAIRGFKAAKGLKGAERTAAISNTTGGLIDSADKILFSD